MMTLFVRSLGIGPDLVLLHGWGFHGGIWDDLLEILLRLGHRVHVVDLPGHGRSNASAASSNIDDWAQAVREVVPSGSAWMGWSLGGMVALAAATLDPTGIRALIMVGASPRFVRGSDWPAALAPELLAEFGRGLKEDWRSTLSRFLALQTRPGTSQIMRRLRTLMLAFPPDPAALTQGLTLLRETDLRPRLSRVTCPTMVLLGARDTLVPVEVSTNLAHLRPDWKICHLAEAGHLPFLTHQAEFLFAMNLESAANLSFCAQSQNLQSF
ncbi:Pimeloyl-(acyl-carrier protein) methyl ester esterase [Gammaproteobacteria bacterium]